MKHFILVFISLLIFSSCTLTGKQEKNLNEALSAYLFARNECNIVNYVALTYPKFVLEKKSKGDSVFQSTFNCNLDSVQLVDPTLRYSVKKNGEIQVLFELERFNKFTMLSDDKKHFLVAISNDNGISWFFLDHSIYVDKSLLPTLKRLLKE